MEKILSTERNWEELLAKHKRNSWLHKLYILSLLTDTETKRKA